MPRRELTCGGQQFEFLGHLGHKGQGLIAIHVSWMSWEDRHGSWRKAMWCIPPEQDGAFVARMEQVLEVYRRPYDPRRPVVCMDEQPVQLVSESQRSIDAAPGRPKRVDYEYVREGTCVVWMFVEPLGCWREVRVTDRRTAVDWAGL